MKKVVVVLTMAIVCTTVSYKSFAQKYFAGTVKLETKYEGDIDPQKHIPHEAELIIFENKMKTSSVVEQVIYDGDAMTITYLYDLSTYGYERMGTVIDKETNQKNSEKSKFSYEARGDTKIICGYECKGYNITQTIKDEEYEEDIEISYIVYTTTEIGKDANINAFEYVGLLGFPMYEEVEKDGVKKITQVKEVKKGKIKAIDFMVSSNYNMYKPEEFREKFKEAINNIFGKKGE